MSHVRIEKPRPHRTQLFVRLTTGNFEAAECARREGRKPVFED